MVDRTYVRAVGWTKAFLTEPANGGMEQENGVTVNEQCLSRPQRATSTGIVYR